MHFVNGRFDVNVPFQMSAIPTEMPKHSDKKTQTTTNDKYFTLGFSG